MCANPTEHTCIPPRPPVLQAEDAQEEEERLKREDANSKKEDEDAIVLYQSDGLGLPMPDGVEAFALVVRCEGADGVAQHLTLGITWDEQFARVFVRRVRGYLRSRSPWWVSQQDQGEQ